MGNKTKNECEECGATENVGPVIDCYNIIRWWQCDDCADMAEYRRQKMAEEGV